MANRRMFSLTVVDTDKFLDMPSTTQALYFHLGMRADDDGFVSSPKKIAGIANCSMDDLKLLIAKGYVIPFESGVIVITHWKQHNYIQSDRYRKTTYKKEREQLELVENVYKLDTENIQQSSKTYTQYRLSKDIVKDIENNLCASDNAPKDSKAAINEFFESIWKLYPSKKGKGQISDSKKKVLYNIGYDELSRAIERYKAGLAKDEWRKPQNGSTFFNSGINSCLNIINANSDMLDTLSIFSDVFADRAIAIFSDINKELKQSFATGNKYGFYTLLRNSFFTSAAQAKNFSVEFLGKIQVFASNTYMVNTNCFKHFKFLLKVILVVLS